MPVNFSVKGIDDGVADRLRLRAERNHRSLQGELMAILEQAAVAEPARFPVAADATAARAGHQRGWKTIEDLLAERRLRPLPITPGLPLAVDLIRADRDSR